MSVVRVAILGHSYVKNLHALSIKNGYLDNGTEFEIKYFFKGGSCFEYWLDWPQKLHDCLEYKPHILFIVLGGNSLVENVRVSHIRKQAITFFKVIKNNLPKVILVPVQVECRFLESVNKFGTPPYSRYRLIRNKLNKAFQKIENKDFLCCIAGKNRLDNIEYYCSDRIHLNSQGIKLYFRCIIKTLNFISCKVALGKNE